MSDLRNKIIKLAFAQPQLRKDLLPLVVPTSKQASRRPLYEIAEEIKKDWKSVKFSAKPYLEALYDLDKVTDRYGADSGKTMVMYFLSNASSWKGETAKRIKAELKQMIK